MEGNIFVGADSLIRGDRGSDVFEGNRWWVLRSGDGRGRAPGMRGCRGVCEAEV